MGGRDSKTGVKLADSGFLCPICEARNYEPVMIDGHDNRPRAIGIYRCTECEFGFVNPERYSVRGRSQGE